MVNPQITYMKHNLMRCWVVQYHHHWSLFLSICGWVHEFKSFYSSLLGLWSKWKSHLMYIHEEYIWTNVTWTPSYFIRLSGTVQILVIFWKYGDFIAICLKQYIPITSWYQNIVRNWKCDKNCKKFRIKKENQGLLKYF